MEGHWVINSRFLWKLDYGNGKAHTYIICEATSDSLNLAASVLIIPIDLASLVKLSTCIN